MKPNLEKILEIKKLYEGGKLGSEKMPEDAHPEFFTEEQKLAYFTLPMALNYQRNSYKLWEAATETFLDSETSVVFDIQQSLHVTTEVLRQKLTKYKVALQPNAHIKIWQTLVKTFSVYGSISKFIDSTSEDFLKLKEFVQKTNKKGFPYLSGPKIFNYWVYILERYCDIHWKNREYIEIAPDTHVIRASIELGVINEQQAEKLSREEISKQWRELLKPLGIAPIDMHSPLWFWDRKKDKTPSSKETK